MPFKQSNHTPAATYRVQLHGKSTFADLGKLADYFERLGISDLYLSPIFTSVPGSLHGYDVTDYSEVNPELGGEEGFRHLADRLRAAGCGIILDFVPNHMGIAGMLNEWWRDVLEHGPLSVHAPFFDIQWNTEVSHDHPRVLVPLLLDHYGKVLEKGEIRLIFDNGFSFRYGETDLPIRPESYAEILQSVIRKDPNFQGAIETKQLADSFAQCAPATKAKDEIKATAAKSRELRKILISLASSNPTVAEQIADELSVINGKPSDARSFDRMHALMEQQHYRLARWQAGAHEINYRRFFAIDTLVGLHMENPEVFRECHAMLGRMLARGDVAGLRIDHIDGLRQPEDYLHRIQSLGRRDTSKPLYLLVEKILEGSETLPEKWPVHGTTGYEFISDVAGVLIDCDEEPRFEAAYRRFTGETRSYPEMVRKAKRLIISEMFANAVSNLGAELVGILANDRNWRDLTRHELTTAVSEIVAHLPVYRTYRRRLEPVSDQDRAVLEAACASAVSDNPRADPQPLEFLRDLLIGRYPPPDAPEAYKNLVLNWALTFQQYTGAIMAKSVEDTVYYNYNRFIALNEVGCDPGLFGNSVDVFHRTNLERSEKCPLALLTTSTHDSKFSEDVRARLYALSELAGDWDVWVAEWSQKVSRHTTIVEGKAMPDALDQYRFFQILVGVWPFSTAECDDSFRSRLKEYFRKAVNEAKRHTSILNSNEAYLAACDGFVDGVLATGSENAFLLAFVPCAGRVARLGMVNSLAQLVIKCTAPGVPDFYQGNEIWDFSLVDPDNRRPVDYALRSELLNKAGTAELGRLLEEWRDGTIKLRVTRDLLHLRKILPAVFSDGSYRAVRATGSYSGNVLSYLREFNGEKVLVVIPRISSRIGCPPLGASWDDTRLELEAGTQGWADVVTGKVYPPDNVLQLRALFEQLPFAVLKSDNSKRPL